MGGKANNLRFKLPKMSPVANIVFLVYKINGMALIGI